MENEQQMLTTNERDSTTNVNDNSNDSLYLQPANVAERDDKISRPDMLSGKLDGASTAVKGIINLTHLRVIWRRNQEGR